MYTHIAGDNSATILVKVGYLGARLVAVPVVVEPDFHVVGFKTSDLDIVGRGNSNTLGIIVGAASCGTSGDGGAAASALERFYHPVIGKGAKS